MPSTVRLVKSHARPSTSLAQPAGISPRPQMREPVIPKWIDLLFGPLATNGHCGTSSPGPNEAVGDRPAGEAHRRPFGMQVVLDQHALGALDIEHVERGEIGLQRLGQAKEAHVDREIGIHAICDPDFVICPDPGAIRSAKNVLARAGNCRTTSGKFGVITAALRSTRSIRTMTTLSVLHGGRRRERDASHADRRRGQRGRLPSAPFAVSGVWRAGLRPAARPWPAG